MPPLTFPSGSPDRYRKGVGIMLINAEGLVFVGKRIDTTSEAWQMPQGGVDEGEDYKAAALRELAEETSITQVELVAVSDHWYYYDLPESLVPVVWNGQYIGQRQKWFLMRFTGTDSDIQLETKEPEFCSYRWVAPKELPKLIVPFKKGLYRVILKEFKSHLA